MRTIKIYTTTSESLKSRMTPSVLSCRETERILSELALKLSDKKQIDYSIANQWLREKLSFNLLRSAVLCVKGSKTTKFQLSPDFSMEAIANAIGKIEQTRVICNFFFVKHRVKYFLPLWALDIFSQQIFINEFVITFMMPCIF